MPKPSDVQVGDERADDFFVGPDTMPTDESGWWETERATFIRSQIVALTEQTDLILDVGCGRGTMLDDDAFATRTCISVDGHIWPEWERTQRQLYVCAEAHALPFRDGSFDLVGSFDVLEHLADDSRALAEQRRVLRVDGRVVTSVPADPRLWSAHDEAVGHHRRYTTESFSSVAEACGLQPTRTSHFFSFLWPPARLLRGSSKPREDPGSSTGVAGAVVQRVIAVLCAAERFVMRRFTLPVGTSLWIESVKSDPSR
jgi:SAM-dependent methyltransferase